MKILSGFEFKNDPKYRFVLTKDFSFYVDLGQKYHEYRNDGKTWAIYEDGVITIKAGYAWNGASPAYRVPIFKFTFWLATPCPYSALIPTLIHDLSWQFAPLARCVWDFNKGNEMFYQAMTITKFLLRDIYHSAVVNIGPFYRRSQKRENISCFDYMDGVEYTDLRAL